MQKTLLLGTVIGTFLIGGCAQTVKSPDEPIEQQAKAQERAVDDLLKPKVDFERAARLYIELGLAYLKDGQIGRAKTKLLRAQKLAPELPEVHYALGFYKEAVGEVDQANKHFLAAIEKNPVAGPSRNNYGTFLCRQGRYRDAEKQFVKATQDPEYTETAEALENAGLCVMQIPDIASATGYFEKAVRMDTRRTEALLELGIIKLNQGVYSEALEYHSLYSGQAEHTPRSLWLGIQVAQHYNDKNKEASYKMLLRNKFPKSAEAKLLSSEIGRG